MKKLNYYGMRKALKKLGISDEDYKKWFSARLNTIINTGTGEGDKHFLVKALFCRILDNEGYRFLTEYPINGRYVDIFCLDNFIAYEIETTKNQRFKKKLGKKMKEYYKRMGSSPLSIYGQSLASDCVKDFSEKNIHVIFVKDLPQDFDEMITKLKKILNKTLIKQEKENLTSSQ